jgi:hypothetical protein
MTFEKDIGALRMAFQNDLGALENDITLILQQFFDCPQ